MTALIVSPVKPHTNVFYLDAFVLQWRSEKFLGISHPIGSNNQMSNVTAAISSTTPWKMAFFAYRRERHNSHRGTEVSLNSISLV